MVDRNQLTDKATGHMGSVKRIVERQMHKRSTIGNWNKEKRPNGWLCISKVDDPIRHHSTGGEGGALFFE